MRAKTNLVGWVGVWLVAMAGVPSVAGAQWGPQPYLSGYYGPGYPMSSAARIQVTPRDTEVYVDGYRAGIVDDFDGFSQRLPVPPGEHVVELYLDGHKTVSQSILFQPGRTYRIRHTMEALASGEAMPPRPAPLAVPMEAAPPPQQLYDGLGRPIRLPPLAGPDTSAATGGSLSIRVQPADAAVLIDGERWQSSGSEATLVVQVTPGPHRVEVQRDGYEPFSTTVQVRPGEAIPINVSIAPRR